MKLEKGMLISIGDWWYVLVEVMVKYEKVFLHCICDNANNIYSFEPHEIKAFMSLKEIGYYNWEIPERLKQLIHSHLIARGIPYDVITEVLTGQHDDRFSHWRIDYDPQDHP